MCEICRGFEVEEGLYAENESSVEEFNPTQSDTESMSLVLGGIVNFYDDIYGRPDTAA